MRRSCMVAGSMLALAGCEASHHSLEWRIRFETEDLASRAEMIEARVVRGSCGDASAEVIYTALFPLADPVAPAPPRLGPGAYSIEAYGRDAACQVIAGDCADRQLPSAETVVELVLQARPPVSACATGEGCAGGLCDSEREPTPPLDAATRDGAITDAAGADSAPDAGSPDAGGLCVPDATDGTGQPCNDASECPAGFVCHAGRIGDLDSARCTRTCPGADGCLPGWSCEIAQPRDCDPSCPDEPICVCDPLFGLAEENLCDGSDGDCDGRIDEATGDVDVCGNGTCRCSACTCDPGFSACGGRCADTSTDRQHCGECGNACRAGFSCSGGTCVCMATMCGTECVNTSANEAHCGGCGIACAIGDRCCAGSCRILASDPANCGVCGRACAAGESCCSGACAGAC